MRIHILQHVPFEGLGSIEPWLAARHAELSYTRFFEPYWSLPALDELDLLILLGGPMSVNDEAKLPWLVQEKAFVAEAIDAGKAVLGICLGAQLIASALGARVYPGPQKEIGWFPLQAEPLSAEAEVFRFPTAIKAFHWHGETFDLPKGAVHLARSAACLHQAFQVGERVLGLQFHLETTPASALAMLEHCADELAAEAGQAYVQSETALRDTQESRYQAINGLMVQVLEYLLR